MTVLSFADKWAGADAELVMLRFEREELRDSERGASVGRAAGKEPLALCAWPMLGFLILAEVEGVKVVGTASLPRCSTTGVSTAALSVFFV